MQNYKLDNELKSLSKYVYHDDKINLPNGYTKVMTTQNNANGFYAQAFYNGKDVVIVYRGTDKKKGYIETVKDFGADYSLHKGKLSFQALDAQNFYNQIKQKYPSKNVVLTGHSLGGSLAQIVGSITGAKTTTFEAYGTGNENNPEMKYFNNITNYGNANDPVFISNINNQVGKTFILKNYKSNQGNVYQSGSYGLHNNIEKVGKMLKYHNLDNIGDLRNAVEYQGNQKDSEDASDKVLKASIEYNVDKNANHIFTREDVRNMSKEEFKASEDKIMKQVYAIGLPTKAEVMANEKKSKSMSSSHKDVSDGGSWVTINGNHVLL